MDRLKNLLFQLAVALEKAVQPQKRFTIIRIIRFLIVCAGGILAFVVLQWETPHITADQEVKGRFNDIQSFLWEPIRSLVTTGNSDSLKAWVATPILVIFWAVLFIMAVTLGKNLWGAAVKKRSVFWVFWTEVGSVLNSIRKQIAEQGEILFGRKSYLKHKPKEEQSKVQIESIQQISLALKTCMDVVRLKIDQGSMERCITTLRRLSTEPPASEILSEMVACTDYETIWLSDLFLRYLNACKALAEKNKSCRPVRYFLTARDESNPYEMAIEELHEPAIDVRRVQRKLLPGSFPSRPNFLYLRKKDGTELFYYLKKLDRVSYDYYELDFENRVLPEFGDLLNQLRALKK